MIFVDDFVNGAVMENGETIEMVVDTVDFVGVDFIKGLNFEEVLAELVIVDFLELGQDVVFVFEEFLKVVG